MSVYLKFLFLILFLTINKSDSEDKLIAKIIPSGYEFVADTVQIKNLILENLLAEGSSLNKVEIKKKQMNSVDFKEYYYLSLTKGNSFYIARWLEKKGNNLYFTNDSNFKMTYLICKGKDDCEPIVFDDLGNYMWSCGTNMFCTIDTINNPLKCKTYKSIILEN
jgi:hypothetical protein